MKRLLFFFLTAVLSLNAMWAQTKVSGTVSAAESGEALSGVMVVIEGTQEGMLTDDAGKYELVAPNGSSNLIFTYYGRKTVREAIGGRSSIDVKMADDAANVDVQVITALGIKREQKALGYAAQTVGGSNLKQAAEMNVVQSLSQKVAGVQVIGSGGTPGASSKIIIRGNSSFTGNNQPLFVIDGVPMDNQTASTTAGDDPFNPTLEGVNNSNRALDINPDDIDNVTVLKGPAAAALYGVRASNGAIVITTKRGSKGTGASGLNINYNTSFQIDQVNKLPGRQLTYGQGNGGARFDANGVVKDEGTFSTSNPGDDGLYFTGDNGEANGTPNSWGPKVANITGATTNDNAANFFQLGTTFNNNLSVAGGNDLSTFRLSLGRTDQKGIVPNTGLIRNSVRLTGETKLSPNLTIFGTANYVNTTSTMAQNGSNLAGVMLSLMRMPSSYDVRGSGFGDGYEYKNGEQHNYFSLYDNPLWTSYHNPFTSNVNRILGNVSATYTPKTWFSAVYRVGTDVYTDQRKQIYEVGSRATGDYNYQGELRENVFTHREVYADLLLTFKKNLGQNIQTSLTLGNNLNSRFDKDLFSRGRFLTIPGFHNMTNASALYTSEDNVNVRSAALFFDANASYKSIFFLNVTGRNEWASTYSKANFFPGANVSFVFSELFKENKVLSFGKVRLAYAQGGNNPPAYTSRTYFTSPLIADGFTNGFGFPFNGQQGFGYSLLGNKDLKPERTIGREVGLDLRFFEGRFTVDFTFYNQLTKDILVLRPLAPSTGFNSYASNSGQMQNQGIELVLGATPVKTKDFDWTLSANFTRNRNKVLELAPGVEQYSPEAGFGDIASFAVVGQPYGVIYGSAWNRTDDGKLIIGANGLPTTDGVNKPLGSPYPDWLSGIRNTFTYKGFSLTALLDIRQGGAIWGGTVARMNRVGTGIATENRTDPIVIEGVVKQTDGTYLPNTKAVAPYNYYLTAIGDGTGSARE
ncbi:MAG: SusC/RagA family TonB-linked outer membrane protein, partial [Bacteroidia bacterium]